MRKTKFWLFQIVMLVMLSLILGSPALADKPVKVDKSVKADSATDSHGYDMRMENANLDSGKASWKTGDSTDGSGDTSGDTSGDDSGDTTSCPEGTSNAWARVGSRAMARSRSGFVNSGRT